MRSAAPSEQACVAEPWSVELLDGEDVQDAPGALQRSLAAACSAGEEQTEHVEVQVALGREAVIASQEEAEASDAEMVEVEVEVDTDTDASPLETDAVEEEGSGHSTVAELVVPPPVTAQRSRSFSSDVSASSSRDEIRRDLLRKSISRSFSEVAGGGPSPNSLASLADLAAFKYQEVRPLARGRG